MSIASTAPKPEPPMADQCAGLPKQVLDGLRAIVGSEYVRSSIDDRRLESRVTLPEGKLCAAVVYPESTGEVQQIVRFANEHRLAVWPFSRGKNWGYGTHTATHAGAVVVILERMNRIVEVNDELAYAVIEPGVSQQQLNEHLKHLGDHLWMDCTDSTPLGSVLGNAIERGVGYTPYGDHFGNLCGLEVVLPNGELLQTGGGPEGCHTQHTHKWGVGPYIEGLFSQSNLGIVTRAGIWLLPKPEAFNFFVCELRRDEDFPRYLDAVRELALDRVIGNVHCFNPFLMLSPRIRYPYGKRSAGESRLTPSQIQELADEQGIAPWTMVCGLYGTSDMVRASRKRVKSKLGRYARITFVDDRKMAAVRKAVKLLRWSSGRKLIHDVVKRLMKLALYGGSVESLYTLPEVYDYHKGVPGDYVVKAAYFKSGKQPDGGGIDPAKHGCGIKWLAPIIPATGEHAAKLRTAVGRLFEKHGFEFPLSVIMLNPRTVIFALPLFFNKDDPDESARVDLLYDELVELIEVMGYQQYRTGVAGMDRVLGGNVPVVNLLRQLKAAVDPEQCLAPGQYGVNVSRPEE